MTVTIAPKHPSEVASVARTLADDPAATVVTGCGESVSLPKELRVVLSEVARAWSDGREVLVAAKDGYVTAQEAADFLGISRPTMVRVLDLGEVPYDRPNSHRRIKLTDLIAYKEQRSKRRATLDGLLAMSDEMREYDIDHFIPTR